MKRKPRRIPEVLTSDEQSQLLAQINPGNISGLRNLAIVRLLLNTGLRAAELIHLKVRDINWKTGQMMVRQGKGNKDRSLWLADDDLALLKQLLARQPSGTQSSLLHLPSSNHPSGDRPIFTSLDGKNPICDRWLRRLFTRLGKKAGIEKRCHPHICRHSFACRLLRQEKNLFLVSVALGHANLSTTQVYLHLENSELENALKKLGNRVK